MPSKIDGTNGVLQAYDYQTPTTGFSYTFSAGTQTLFMVPAATLATGTITMPASPADGMMITFSSSQQITALTLQGNTGQSISSAVTFLPAKTAAAYVYRLSNTTWYPTETVPGTGSQLVSGVSQASTSGTSIDFTGIPSWVKRITLMFNGVSTNGTGGLRVQIGTSGGVQNTGYSGANSAVANSNVTATAALSNGFDCQGLVATSAATGTCVLSLIDAASGIWIATMALADSGQVRTYSTCGTKTLSATLDRLRVTTVTGTDTFDAGTINILYE